MTKYNNNKIVVDGTTFDSKHEALYYDLLKRKKAAGEILNYELQPKYELQPSFEYFSQKIRAINYVADFLIYHDQYTLEVIDIKGMATETATLKRKLMQYEYPHLKLTWLSRSLKYGDADGWIDYDELKRRRR